MKQLYKSIQQLFRQPETVETFTALNLYAPAFIDLYNGQPESPDDFEFATPALFIDYSIDWEKAGTMRKGQLTLEVHVLTDPTPETDSLADSPDGLEKIDYYETVSKIFPPVRLPHLPSKENARFRPITLTTICLLSPVQFLDVVQMFRLKEK